MSINLARNGENHHAFPTSKMPPVHYGYWLFWFLYLSGNPGTGSRHGYDLSGEIYNLYPGPSGTVDSDGLSITWTPMSAMALNNWRRIHSRWNWRSGPQAAPTLPGAVPNRHTRQPIYGSGKRLQAPGWFHGRLFWSHRIQRHRNKS